MIDNLKISSLQLGIGSFGGAEKEGNKNVLANKNAQFYKNSTKSLVKGIDLRKSYLDLGNFKTLRQSITRSSF